MSYLARYDDTPDGEKWALVRKWMDEEPLPFFAELRERRPILATPACTLLARYEDCVETLLLPNVFTVRLYAPKMGTYMLAQDDTPAHFRDKAVMHSMLNRNDVPMLRQFIGDQAKAILAVAGGRIDVVSQITRMVPALLVRDKFGFTGAAPAKLLEWSLWNQWDTFHNQPFDFNDDPAGIHQKAQAALVEMKNFLVALAARRLVEIKAGGQPDDIFSRMLRTSYPASVGFGFPDLILNVGGLLIGAVETTSQAATQALAELLACPETLAEAQALAAQDDPTAFDGYVWEALRFQPISPYLFRYTASDYVVAKGSERETLIAADTIILPLIQSASFDASRFPDPDSFDPTRPIEQTFHLGFGLHECLGKYIAQVMIPELVRQILRLPNLAATGPIDWNGTPFPDRFEVTWG